MSVQTKLIQDIVNIYDELKETYQTHINQDKKEKSYGGTYYGATELYSISGVQFEKGINFVDYGYALNTLYDVVFKVGTQHDSEFKGIKADFIREFNEKLNTVLERHGFDETKKCPNESGYVHVRVIDEVTHGTNFSVYCGIKLYEKKENDYKEYRFDFNKAL